MAQHWSANFFRGLVAELWHRATPPERTEAEATFLEEALDAPERARLLDVPCGYGRLSLALAARGYRMTGVDLSEPFLAEARAEARRAGLGIDYLRRDMRNLRWRDRFTGAFCVGNSFGVFDRADTARFLAGVGRALAPGSHFVLDTDMTAETLLPEIEHRVWLPLGELLVLAENDYDYRHSRLDTHYTLIKGERREQGTAHQWIFTLGEIDEMLARAGLAVEALYEDLERTPFAYGSRRVILIARKRGLGKR